MKNRLAVLLLAISAMAFNGCCCCQNWCNCCDVAVDYEDLCHCLHHNNCQCAHNYPYSCPPCPYYDQQNCTWHKPYFAPKQTTNPADEHGQIFDAEPGESQTPTPAQ